ncbi:MAG TPA: hypothetical protein VF698_10680 [Thermoanaerobaculia bacterium]|jgi:hypothetical protein
MSLIDERFLEHRRRSTSTAGITVAALALLVFMWRLYVHHVWSWDLLAVGATFVVIKMTLMLWYRLRD